jgi:hypothetical protein
VADEQEQLRLRKVAAAAAHAVWVAEREDEAVEAAERKVAKARDDLNAARDALENAKQQAKEAHAAKDAAVADAERDGLSVEGVKPANKTEAKAQAASAGVTTSGRGA